MERRRQQELERREELKRQKKEKNRLRKEEMLQAEKMVSLCNRQLTHQVIALVASNSGTTMSVRDCGSSLY